MSAPNLQAQATTFRTTPYHYTGWLVTPTPTVVFSRAVNMATISYPRKTITFDNPYSGTGATGDVLEDMDIFVYDGNTAFLKGTLRVAAGAASGSTLQVNEFSRGWLDLSDNDRIDVVRRWSIRDKPVSDTAAFLKDSRIASVAQTKDKWPPIANMGGHVGGFIDVGQIYKTVSFDWTTSVVTDPASVSPLTYLADFKDGTVITGSTTSSTATVRFPVGEREIDLTVTDADNGVATTKRAWVIVKDRDANQPLHVRKEADGSGYSHEDGWRMTFSLPYATESSLTGLPNGALIIYFEEEYYGGILTSYGSGTPTDRSQIKFVGYLVSESIEIDPISNVVTFEALSPLGILGLTAALPQLLIRKSVPADWQHAASLNTLLFQFYQMQWHTSFLTLFDFVSTEFPALAYSRLATQTGDSFRAQIQDIAGAVGCLVTCDRAGRLLMQRKPWLESSTQRNSRTTIYALTPADRRGLTLPIEQRRKVKQVQASGIIPHTASITEDNLPAYSVFSNAPQVPAEGTTVKQLDKLIGAQAQVDAWVGHDYAHENGLYYETTHKTMDIVPMGARIPVPLGYDWLDPALLPWITNAVAATSNKRGRAYASTERWLVNEVSINYSDNGEKDDEWTVDHETYGVPGVPRPNNPATSGPILNRPPINVTNPGIGLYVPPPLGYNLERGTQGVFAVNDDGFWYRCAPALTGSGFDTTYPLWERGATGIAGTPNFTAVDPFSYQTASIDGWHAATDGIYQITDMGGTPIFSLSHAFAHHADFAVIDTSIAAPGFILAIYYNNTATAPGTYAVYSIDDGANWTEKQITAFRNTSFGVRAALYVSIHTAGVAYAEAIKTADYPTGAGALYKTTDYGANWALVSAAVLNVDPGISEAGALHFPWANNAAETIVLYGVRTSDLDGNFTFRTLGAVTTDITPVVGGLHYGPRVAGYLKTSTMDNNSVAMIGSEAAGATGILFTSRDRGTTWTVALNPSTPYNWVHVPDDPNVIFLCGVGGAFAYSSDFGVSIQDKSGNIPTDFPSAGIALGNLVGI